MLLKHLLGGIEEQRRDRMSWQLKDSCCSSVSAPSMMGPTPLAPTGGDGAQNPQPSQLEREASSDRVDA